MADNSRPTTFTKVGGIICIGIQNLKLKSLFVVPLIAMGLSFGVQAQANQCGEAGVSLDHVIWAVPDLEEYVARFEEITSIKPEYGGKHTNGLTENYLVSLGECTYLEILGPQKGVTPEQLGSIASRFTREHIVGFAFGADLENPPQSLSSVRLGDRNSGGRNKPDGTALSWVTQPLPDFDFGPDRFQFVIKWTSEPHPAATSPKGAEIAQLTIANPQVTGLQELVESNRLPIVLQPSGVPNMWLTIRTPRGSVILR